MVDYLLALPELLLIVVVFWALFADKLIGRDRGAAFVGFIVASMVAVLAAIIPTGQSLFGGLLFIDASSRFIRVAIAVLTAIWMLWVAGRRGTRTREAVAVAALVSLGAMLTAGAQELITLFVCIDLMTLPGYILIGYNKENRHSLEGALKYFLLSMTTSLVMLYGFSLLYGATGTTRFAGLGEASGLLPVIAGVLILAGIFAKLSAAPFHFWAPDAYEGAESWLVAFVSTVPKVATSLVLLRLAVVLLPMSVELLTFMIIVSVASIVLGNLAALGQHDMRRMMAYSGVAQIGYALIGIIAFTSVSLYSSLYFVVCYAVAAMGVLLAVSEVEGNTSFKNLAGYGKAHPALSAVAVIMLLSLIGIPPLAGFFGKFYLFAGALGPGNEYLWLVIVAIVGSVVSAAYYLRPVKAMFFDAAPAEDAAVDIVAEETAPAKARVSVLSGAALVACFAATVALGVFASQLFTFLLQAG